MVFSSSQLYISMALVMGVALMRGVLITGVLFRASFFSRAALFLWMFYMAY